jgi:hypothetical protein
VTRTTSIEWPEAVLGCPLRAGYEVEVPPMFERTSLPDAPIAFARARHDEARYNKVDFIWTADQLAAFTNFLTFTINNGLAAFMMKHLAGGTLVPMFTQMLDPPTITPLPDRLDRYRVAFRVVSYWRVGATKGIT